MELLEKDSYWGGIIGDAVSILKAKALKKKKLRAENVTAYLFTAEQVSTVLSMFDEGEINVWEEDGIFCLSRYKLEDLVA